MSKLIAEVCKLFQITKLQTSSYHPQTNAACERMNSFILQSIKAYCKEDHSNWPDVLPSVLQAYRFTPATESTGFSPYYLMFGRDPPIPIDVALLPSTNIGHNAKQHLERIQQNQKIAHRVAHDNIAAAQQKYKHQHDKKAAPPPYKENDQVWLFCNKTKTGISPKLCRKFVGPYYICIDYGNHTYKLRRKSDHCLVKSVAHANRLRPYISPNIRPTNPPVIDDSVDLNPEEIADDFDDTKDKLPASQATSNQSSTENQSQNRVENDLMDRPLNASEIAKIIKCTRYKGERLYRIRLTSGTGRSEWYRENSVPEELIIQFHANKTQQGRARKKRQLHKKR